MSKDLEKNITRVRTYISNICGEFYVWKAMQKSENNKIYNKDKYFWLVVFESVQNDFLINLAKLFEAGKDDVLSVHYLLSLMSDGEEKELIKGKMSKYKSVIKNLVIWRHKILAHNDIYFAHNPTEIFKKFPIKNNELGELIDLAGDMLGEVHSIQSGTGQIYSYKRIKDESESDTNNVVQQIKAGYKSEEERFEKEFKSYGQKP